MDGQWKRSRTALLIAGGIGLGLASRKLIQRWREADLRGQVVLITGGSRGLGFLMAREFAHEGCRIAICARNERELERAREDLAHQGADVMAVQCDISERAQVQNLVAQVTRRFGRVDVLVNNAGIIQVGPIENMTVGDFEKALNIMFWGVVYPALEVLPQMLQRKSGRIVNITSIGGKVSLPHLLPYDCAKFAAVGFSEGLRAELAAENISVTTIVPGLMRTGSFLNALFKGKQKPEYTWFSLGSTLPFVSMDAERAARQIVSATKRGVAETTLSIPANILDRFQGLFPGTTANLLGIVNRLLPSAGESSLSINRGGEIQAEVHSPLLDFLTQLGLSAARRFHQYPGPTEALGQDSQVRESA